MSAQNGMPITVSRQIETYPPVILRYYAGLIRKKPVSEVRAGLFTRTGNDARIAREEIFGPVLTVIEYADDAEAVRIANDSEYGLGGTVWSSDPSRAMAVASAVQTGTVGINGYVPEPVAPYGGVKASGIGKEFGPEGLASYQSLKSIYQF